MSQYPGSTELLTLTSITKSFGSNTALDSVDLAINAGTIHAVIGMNGSGKSTLVKVLSGFYTQDSGTIEIAERSGAGRAIAFVHQDLALIDGMTVIENMTLSRRLATRHGRIDWRSERRLAARALRPFGLDDSLDSNIQDLTKAQATIVAIARALEQREDGLSILVLDEPTSTLPAAETEELLTVMRSCAAEGLGVLFISHRLGEVVRVADEVTVLRNGVRVHHGATAGHTVSSLSDTMAGDARAELSDIAVDAASGRVRRAAPESPVALDASCLSGTTVTDLDIEVRAGEVLGIAGLLGSGVEELGGLLSNRIAPVSGKVSLFGTVLGNNDMSTVGYVPAQRVAQGVFGGLTTRENASFTTLPRYLRAGRINRRREQLAMHEAFSDMTVYPADTEGSMTGLSGGNQQKVIFARWLSAQPTALVAEEPTQGVDVHAKAQILGRLRQHARDGLAVVLLSGEPEEISSACDRMIVLSRGAISAEFTAPISIAAVMTAMHSEAS